MIPLAAPYIAGREAEYVAEALNAGEVGAGSFVTRFEDAVRDFTGARHAVAMSSGTAALHIALLLAGVKPGDEVIVPATTFIATARAVQYCGATPVIVDVERETWGLDFEKVNGIGGSRPMLRAIATVHLYGHPAFAHPSRAVVADSTEALGAGYGSGRRVGYAGLHALSFNANKLITTGGGGMLLTEDVGQAMRARSLINQARALLDGLDAGIYGQGFNYRLPNVNAAIGLAQMENIDRRLASKRETAEHYQRELPGVFHEQPWARSSYWMSAMLLPDATTKERVMAHLRDKGIETRSVWRPLNRQPGLGSCPAYTTEVADDLYARGLCLPCSAGITHAEREQVIAAIREVIG